MSKLHFDNANSLFITNNKLEKPTGTSILTNFYDYVWSCVN